MDEKSSEWAENRPERTASSSREVDNQVKHVESGQGYSGQEYDSNDFAAEKALKAAGETGLPSQGRPDTTMPPENGRRAYFDSRTGEVFGSGSGAGGGNPGEDFDSDASAGDGWPKAGVENSEPQIEAENPK